MPNPTSAPFPPFYIDLPFSILGWAGWLALLGLIVYGNWKLREVGPTILRQRWMVLVGLAVLAPVLALLFPIRIPFEQILPVPGLPVDPRLPVLFVLAGLAWVLAGGIAAPVWACLIGAVTGLAVGFYETHHLFSMLEYAGLAWLFSLAVRQKYRTRFFSVLRHPLGAGLFLAVVCAPFYILSAFFATNGPLVARIDYAITQTWPLMLTRGVEMLIACLVAEGILVARPAYWGRPGPLVASPMEKSLQLRFFVGTAPLVFLLLLTLTIGDWLVAGNAARNMIRDRLTNTAQIATNSLPYFLETGQNLLVTLGDPALLSLSGEEQKASLGQRIRSVPYFRQLFLFNSLGKPLTGYPKDRFEDLQVTDEEKAGIDLATKGVMVLTYVIPSPTGENSSVQVSYLAPVRNAQNQISGVLLGRTDLDSNPFTQPAIQAIDTIKELGGEGYILDENGRILYHSNPEQIMGDYSVIGKNTGTG